VLLNRATYRTRLKLRAPHARKAITERRTIRVAHTL
jgi:hypothetical protein|tara:strand:- start:3021 stop:3128 length:108 start_codon:yes stop_codon:yes gene_type:complete